MVLTQQHQEQQHIQDQEQKPITRELVQKFDGDRELVEKFIEHGYSVQQLEQSSITHPTATDPVCTLNGKVLGFWL